MAAADGIVVGYDGSPSSKRALSWAGREAAARELLLTVCHAYEAAHQTAAGLAGPQIPEPARCQAERVIGGCREHAQDAAGPGSVRWRLAQGPAAEVLTECGRQADMLVLGAYGCGREVPDSPLGSVAAHVAWHGQGRIVVVRGHWRPAGGYAPGPILAGLDGSPGSMAALQFAFEEARLRAGPLLVVCALADSAVAAGTQQLIREDVERLLAAAAKDNPEVTILQQVTDCGAIAAILMAAREAQMVVVGRRGRGGSRRTGLGSVGQALVQHAPCPVGIAREP